ncbi:PepSY domain-containing protein [Thalassotalea euphylliae]|uniref:PepSY domain-containing protein n=1 Tax=Thalassotalea euphylliae TaxID=1655234 RepID=UPI0036254815
MNKAILAIILGVLLMPVTHQVSALPYYSADNHKFKPSSKNTISARQAASIVQSAYGGKVLKVQSSGKGYRVKLLKQDGRIISVFVDGKSGRIKG